MTTTSDSTAVIPLDELPDLVGRSFGPSSWRTITQDEVAAYAELSGDRNPIHLDPDFAAGTAFGGTIAHGYLTLSLIVPLMAEVFQVTGVGVGINYGLDRLRFPAPVPVGSRIRALVHLVSVDPIAGDSGYQVVARVTFEIDGGAKPACVADQVLRYYR
ncbi:MaoC family dehydratase [Naasia lichenicola]|uniref:MaoC family dehydratase n=1 Tax=Naasia lichenicola TaxID=2565933 RepID=A0A4S4FI55_9MICO|nr:MaoC family dehydratase [Naasia lichenicola]THG29524.1 MaoC family dehydratase [Naasia lichenicola]